jgi:hypothetical protein
MKIEVTKNQYKRIIFNLLDSLYGPEFSIEKNNDLFQIYTKDGEEIAAVYTKNGRSKGCKRDIFVLAQTTDDIESFISKSITRKKLFSKTFLSYINERTKLNIDCIEFWYDNSNDRSSRYAFSVKKNKRIRD